MSFVPVSVGPVTIRLASDDFKRRSKLHVYLEHPDGTTNEVEFPFLSHGIAGGRFIGSPSGRFVVVSVFSGQSEEGFGLIDVAASELIWWSGYQYGEGASFAFDSKEERVVMVAPDLCDGWWLPWEEGDVDQLEDGALAFDFGTILVHRIGSQSSIRRRVRFRVDADWTPPTDKEGPHDLTLKVSDETLEIEFPWGSESIAILGSETIWLSPDRAG